MTQRVVQFALCADDFGLYAGVDDAVCALLDLRRLSAVSCMSSAPRWLAHAAPRLRERRGADLGLHWNLTEHFGAPGPGLRAMLVRSHARRFDARALEASLERQCDAFEQGIGRAPDFIDGHQHIHQLPQLREALLTVCARRYPSAGPWVRNTLAPWGRAGVKGAILRLLGGAALARQLRASLVPTNTRFAGLYGFDRPDYDRLMAHWLAGMAEGGLIMCHPASDWQDGDLIGPQRVLEYRFLASDAFATMLASRQLSIAPLSAILAPFQEFTQAAVNVRETIPFAGMREHNDAR